MMIYVIVMRSRILICCCNYCDFSFLLFRLNKMKNIICFKLNKYNIVDTYINYNVIL